MRRLPIFPSCEWKHHAVWGIKSLHWILITGVYFTLHIWDYWVDVVFSIPLRLSLAPELFLAEQASTRLAKIKLRIMQLLVEEGYNSSCFFLLHIRIFIKLLQKIFHPLVELHPALDPLRQS